MKKEKYLDSSVIFNGKVVNLSVDEVLLPNGKHSTREVIHHRGGACVVAERDGKICFTRQYRYAVGDFLLELPAGKRENDEPPIETADRELTEETGLKADKLVLIQKIVPTPGYTDEVIYIYYAEGLTSGLINLDDDEFIETEWIEIDRVKQMLLDGEIIDGKTVVGLYGYLAKVEDNKL